jgi:ketosteroid isomerase-like protein
MMRGVSANTDLIRAWIASVNSHDFEETVALVTPDFELVESSTLPGAATATGPEGLRRYGEGWARNWSDWQMREVEMVEVPPSHVVLAADLALRGIRSGIEVERRWIYLLRIRDGRIMSQIGYDSKEAAVEAAQSG